MYAAVGVSEHPQVAGAPGELPRANGGRGCGTPGVVARRVVAVDRGPEVDVEEEPQQMEPEERLFRARQSWPVYAFFAFSVIVAVTLILASR